MTEEKVKLVEEHTDQYGVLIALQRVKGLEQRSEATFYGDGKATERIIGILKNTLF